MLNYEQRVLVLTGAVDNFLTEYKRPEHLREATPRLAKIKAIAEAVNAKMSPGLNKDGFHDQLERIFREMRLTHKFHEWPEPAAFARAASECVRSYEQRAIEGEKDLPDASKHDDPVYWAGRFEAKLAEFREKRLSLTPYFPKHLMNDKAARECIQAGLDYDLIWEIFGKGTSKFMRAHIEANSPRARERHNRVLEDLAGTIERLGGTPADHVPNRFGYVKGKDYTDGHCFECEERNG